MTGRAAPRVVNSDRETFHKFFRAAFVRSPHSDDRKTPFAARVRAGYGCLAVSLAEIKIEISEMRVRSSVYEAEGNGFVGDIKASFSELRI